MSLPSSTTVKITLLDREYELACSPEQKAQLATAGHFLEQRLQAAKAKSKAPHIERIALMTALALADQLLETQRMGSPAGQIIDPLSAGRLRSVQNKLEQVLAEQ